MYKTLRRSLLILSSLLLAIQIHADWSFPPLPVTEDLSTQHEHPHVCCSAGNTAFAIWKDDTFNTIRAAFFNGTSWDPSVQLSNSGDNVNLPQICCDGNGKAFAIWRTSAPQIQGRYFNGSIWEPLTPLSGMGASDPQLSCNSSGQAIVVWTNTSTNVINYATYNGSWSSAAPVAAIATAQKPDVSCDENGHAIAVWMLNNGGTFIASSRYTFLTDSWSNLGNIPDSDTDSPPLAPLVSCDDVGNAVAVWLDSETLPRLRGSFFNGTTWSSTYFNISDPGAVSNAYDLCLASSDSVTVIYNYSPGLFEKELRVTRFNPMTQPQIPAPPFHVLTVNDPGNTDIGTPQVCCDDSQAAAVWMETQFGTVQQTFAANFDGSIWSSPVPLSDQVGLVSSTSPPSVCCRGGGNAIAVWTDGNPVNQVQSSFFTGSGPVPPSVLLPPATFSARRFMSRFATQSASFALLFWTPSPSEGVVAYQIFQDGVLIATVPASQLSYKVCLIPPCVPLTFTIRSVNAANQTSDTADTVTI